MTHLFISYSTANSDYADRLADALRAEGFDVWLDNRRLRSSENWWEAIVRALRGAAAVIVIMTPESRASRWVQREITLADKWSKPTFPLLLDGNGDDWELFVLTQYDDLRDGQMPPARFYNALAEVAPRSEVAGANRVSAPVESLGPVDAAVAEEMATPPEPDEPRKTLRVVTYPDQRKYGGLLSIAEIARAARGALFVLIAHEDELIVPEGRIVPEGVISFLQLPQPVNEISITLLDTPGGEHTFIAFNVLITTDSSLWLVFDANSSPDELDARTKRMREVLSNSVPGDAVQKFDPLPAEAIRKFEPLPAWTDTSPIAAVPAESLLPAAPPKRRLPISLLTVLIGAATIGIMALALATTPRSPAAPTATHTHTPTPTRTELATEEAAPVTEEAVQDVVTQFEITTVRHTPGSAYAQIDLSVQNAGSPPLSYWLIKVYDADSGTKLYEGVESYTPGSLTLNALVSGISATELYVDVHANDGEGRTLASDTQQFVIVQTTPASGAPRATATNSP